MSSAEYEELRTAFTAAVSHELRTPLARLLTLLESAELPGADLPQLLRQAREQVDEMTELVDDILFLSELEEGREVVALGETEAAPVLRDVVAEREERAANAGLKLELRIDEESMLVRLRRRMLRTVAENLVENAIRYSPEGGEVRVTATSVDGGTELRVLDGGAGVPVDQRTRVFERFETGAMTRANRGLGLAFCKLAVEAQGGRIWIEDASPGAAFCIWFPSAT